ncbi:hypothetical protein Golob_011072 [Gossypium lobatum]|uniref:RNase H type-1 domain-containing protein n=1 Tax=Gossypium lobatum TaxID=34289 RepID=A0A7J8MND0_9ROSI|nr:hypothetical protein [Gossypium lobatum]
MYVPRERNKVVDKLAKMASDRNTEVEVFVNFPKEMLDEFGFDEVNVSLLGHLSKLVENLCNGNIVENRKFCLKALSTPKAIATRDSTQLGTLIMKLGAANVKATLNVYDEITKKPGSPQALTALNC